MGQGAKYLHIINHYKQFIYMSTSTLWSIYFYVILNIINYSQVITQNIPFKVYLPINEK